jgi:hypothetical protein
MNWLAEHACLAIDVLRDIHIGVLPGRVQVVDPLYRRGLGIHDDKLT